MPERQAKKGLPKRAGRRTELAAKREAQHRRGAAREADRIAAQEERHQANLARIERGEPTPWQQSKLDAKARKAEAKQRDLDAKKAPARKRRKSTKERVAEMSAEEQRALAGTDGTGSVGGKEDEE